MCRKERKSLRLYRDIARSQKITLAMRNENWEELEKGIAKNQTRPFCRPFGKDKQTSGGMSGRMNVTKQYYNMHMSPRKKKKE